MEKRRGKGGTQARHVAPVYFNGLVGALVVLRGKRGDVPLAKAGWLLLAALAHRLQYAGLYLYLTPSPSASPPLECGGISIILVGNLVWLSCYPLPLPRSLIALRAQYRARWGAIMGNYCRHDIVGKKCFQLQDDHLVTRFVRTSRCATTLAEHPKSMSTQSRPEQYCS